MEFSEKSADPVLLLWLPCAFVVFANQLVTSALRDHGLPSSNPLSPASGVVCPGGMGCRDFSGLQLVYWRISHYAMWQGMDKRIDEIFEVLWRFRRAQQQVSASTGSFIDFDFLRHEFAKRRHLNSPEEELEEFAKWVATPPESGYCSFNMGSRTRSDIEVEADQHTVSSDDEEDSD
ncbi:hypothetical protein BOTBODRAFT_302458 [Botryobasidium botryosum FD-172 SS1]|uniref:Uncharacterized protein n=1 Tax=Botryobasidium botryosum (strain FD-172 SS1) TaxID=930990 RepID=A0A067MH53_BOTB1|nr:hypothetical protein BOTBODRAFT_302458 [Botryobasidium botryosum FD-172 SS1]